MSVNLGLPLFSYSVLKAHLGRLKYLHNCHRTLAISFSESLFMHRSMVIHRPMIRNDLLQANKYVVQSCCFAKKAIVKESKGKGQKPRMLLTDSEMMEVIRVDVMRTNMQQIVDRLKESFLLQLSVRSSSGSIENLKVILNGEEFPLHEIAQIHKKKQNLIVINMSDCPEGLKPTLEAICNSQMNLNPQQDGTMIYIPLQKMTREHRETLVKNAKSMFNSAKDELREVQNKFQKDIKKKKTNFSEDLIFAVHSQVKEIADEYMGECEKMLQSKEKELLAEL